MGIFFQLRSQNVERNFEIRFFFRVREFVRFSMENEQQNSVYGNVLVVGACHFVLRVSLAKKIGVFV